ncbi:MAG TPA: tRNA lysidine(34) synthetase TilS [Terricaulis sp.]|nr:tRNA lysidine(34) synthetase TilS [Terricaulis sp.]
MPPEASLDPETLARMLARAEGGPIVLALSGGGDSTALLHLLHDALGPGRLIAAVVDHALREGSAEDAARAAGFADALGVQTLTLRLDWPYGPRRAQASARAARYGALCDAARDAGARLIALGHTRDDQAETVLLRGARGSAWRGLAGMRALAPAPVWPEGRGLCIARPLLKARRADLRAYLRARGAAWIEDPANANADFARVRARQTLAAMGGFDPMRLAALAERLAPAAAALDQDAHALIERAARFEADEINVDDAALGGASEARTRALSVLIAAAAGAAREPGAEQLAALEAQIGAPGFKAATLGGALIRKRRGALVLGRDGGALAGRADGAPAPAPLPLPAGRETVWDGRAALTMADAGWEVVAAGAEAHLQRGAETAPLLAAAPRWLLAEHAAHRLNRD